MDEASGAGAGRGMNKPAVAVLPYCEIIGQESVRLALEIAFVCPAVGGGTGHGTPGNCQVHHR